MRPLVPGRRFALRCSHDIAMRLWPAMRDKSRARVSMLLVSERGKPPALVVDTGYSRFAVPLLAGAERGT